MPQAISLRDYLTRENPALEVKGSKSRNNTTNAKYPEVGRVVPWMDFKLNTINNLFERRLSTHLEKLYHDLSDPPKLRTPDLEIKAESCLQSLFEKSNQHIVAEALERSKDLLKFNVFIVIGDKSKLLYGNSFKPDLAGQSDVENDNNILPGDAKLSAKFGSKFLRTIPPNVGVKNQTESYIWPLRQLLRYSVNSGMRYGYIITDKELIILRIGTFEERLEGASFKEMRQTVEDRSLIEWRAIPWDNSGNTLTINLALWTLHILAANNGLLDWKYETLEDEKLRNEESRARLQPDQSSFPSDLTNSKENTQQEVENDTVSQGNPSQGTAGSFLGRPMAGLDLSDSFGPGSQSLKPTGKSKLAEKSEPVGKPKPSGKRKLESEPSDDTAPRRRRRTKTKKGLEAR